MNRKAIVICKSVHHQNTMLIAEAVAEVLHAEIIDPDETMGSTAGAFQLVGVGSGIYGGRFHAAIRDWVVNLPEGAGNGHDAFLFSTSGLPFLSALYHAPLRRRLRLKGFRIVGDFACRGHDTFSFLRWIGGLNRRHPNACDVARAKTFASHLKASRR